VNKSESISKLAPAILKAQKSMGNAIKDSKNPFFKSSYADLNAVREACMPALNDNGISVLQTTLNVDNRAYVRTTLLHESGEFISSDTEILTSKANDAQGYGSGISYARRYGLQALVCLGSADDDGEGAMGRTPTKTWAKPTTLEPSRIAVDITTVSSKLVSEPTVTMTAIETAPVMPVMAAKVAKLAKPSFRKEKKAVEGTAAASTEGSEWGE
jgi:hypothetical protein